MTTTSRATPPHVTYKAAVGLLFTHEPHAILHADGHVDLHFMISMPPLGDMAQEIYNDENIAIECNLNGTGQNLCLYIKNITKVELKQLKHLKHQTERHMNIHDDLVDQFTLIEGPQKRSWLPLGGIFSTVFGTAKHSDVKKLKAKLKVLSTNAQALDANYDNLYTAFQDTINATTHHVNALVKLVRHQDETLLSTIQNMDKLNNQVNDFVSFASPSELNYLLELLAVLNRLQQRTEHILQFHDVITEFTTGLKTLAKNNLPSSLISQKSLVKGLRTLSFKIRRYNYQPLPYNHLKQFYYRTSTIMGHIMDKTLVITVPVPIISSTPLIFNLYHMTTQPIPIHGPTTNQAPFTRLHLQHEYFLISTNNDYYGFATSAEVTACRQNAHVCHLSEVLHHRSRGGCEYNIFSNIDNIDRCDFRVYIQDSLQSATRVGKHEYLLHGFNQSITIKCAEKDQTQMQITTHTIVTLGCYCHIVVDNVIIGPRIDDCDSTQTSEIIAEYPVNLQLAREMNALSTLKFPQVDFTSQSQPTANFIDMSKYTEQLQRDLHSSLEFGINAQQVFEKLGQYKKQELDNTIYIPDESSMSLIEMILFAILTLWNILITLALVAFWYLSRHGNAPDIPNVSAIASALPLVLTFDIGTTPPTTPTPCAVDEIEDELTIMAYALLGTTACFILYAAYTILSQYRSYKQLQDHSLLNQTAGLYYKIFSTDHQSILFLRDIPVDSRMKIAELPRFKGYSLITKSCWPKINLDWQNDLSLQLGEDMLTITMPNTFHVSIKNAAVLKAMNDDNYYGCLLIKRHDQNYYSNIRNEDATAYDM